MYPLCPKDKHIAIGDMSTAWKTKKSDRNSALLGDKAVPALAD